MDEIGTAHDEIRGADRNFEKLLLVAELIADLKKTYPHVVFWAVHTVISKLNVHRIAEIERGEARAIFRPDSYIAEVAENRVELKTMHKDITPDPRDFRRAVAHLGNTIRSHRSGHPVARLVESLRLEYYELAATILEEKRQVIDCYAGWASAHIAPDGHVWGCCVRAPSRWGTSATMDTISRPYGWAAKPTRSARAFASTSARARSPKRATRTSCSTLDRSSASD